MLWIFNYLIVALVTTKVRGALVQPTIWPEPSLCTFAGDNSTLIVSPELNWVTQGGDIDTLTQLYDRYSTMMFSHDIGEAKVQLSRVVVAVEDRSEGYPTLATDESYTLSITEDSSDIAISALTVYGVIRAVETLSQLIAYDFDARAYITPVSIVKDEPRYQHRGMLLDTARHFQPVATIQRVIDSLAMAKMNVLHWHAVDTQAFPFESTSNPRLWEGSYTARERYSRSDIVGLVEYGRLRGVKMMLEFDVPGHAASWCKGYPEVCPSLECTQPLDPSSAKTLPLINDLIVETTSVPEDGTQALFPYDLFHLGGDEVAYDCWDASSSVRRWQRQNNLDDEGTYKYFVDTVAQYATQASRTPVQWVEVFEHFGDELSKDVIIHVWKDKPTLDKVISAGYRALLSNSQGPNLDGDWYLDHTDATWEMMYINEPTSALSEGADASLILGGEACLWAEKVDPSDLFSTMWPRAAAVAEVLWTPQSKMDLARAESRLQTFRCLLTQRGIGAAPVKNKAARSPPSEPGSCYAQRR